MKKFLSVLLCALLVCGIATGCVKGSENGGGGFSIIPKKNIIKIPLPVLNRVPTTNPDSALLP